VLSGGYGQDALRGGPGFDRLEGGPDQDLIYLSGDGDRALGGRGLDFLDYQSAPAGVTVELSETGRSGTGRLTGGGPVDDFAGFNNVAFGSRHADVLLGSSSDDYLDGGNGNDYLDGSDGEDELEGGDGTDTCINGEHVRGCEQLIALRATG
jgi:hypothetical protein